MNRYSLIFESLSKYYTFVSRLHKNKTLKLHLPSTLAIFVFKFLHLMLDEWGRWAKKICLKMRNRSRSNDITIPATELKLYLFMAETRFNSRQLRIHLTTQTSKLPTLHTSSLTHITRRKPSAKISKTPSDLSLKNSN